MSIKINGSILYNENDGTLTQVGNTDKKIVLIRSTSRLLSFFIENNNQLVLRERLINEVLVEYGLKASNSNLNNYISVLRKSLAHFGEDDIIVTYPRQGFKFIAASLADTATGEIFDGCGGGEEKNQAITENVAHASKDIDEPGDTTATIKERTKKNKAPILMLIIASVFIVSLIYYFISLSERPLSAAMYRVDKYDNCQVYSSSKTTDVIKILPKIIQSVGFNCKKNANIYYYENVKKAPNDSAIELVIFCPADDKAPCMNRYLSHDKEVNI